MIEVTKKLSTRNIDGGCHECDLRNGENYNVWLISIKVGRGIATEFRFCEIHVTDFANEFNTALFVDFPALTPGATAPLPEAKEYDDSYEQAVLFDDYRKSQ